MKRSEDGGGKVDSRQTESKSKSFPLSSNTKTTNRVTDHNLYRLLGPPIMRLSTSVGDPLKIIRPSPREVSPDPSTFSLYQSDVPTCHSFQWRG